MSINLFKNFIKKSGVSSSTVSKVIEKQSPPGPPPRPGLKWKPSTHRWIIDQQHHSGGMNEEFPENHGVHETGQYLTADIEGTGFDLHEGMEVTYEVYPFGQNIPATVTWDDEEDGYVLQTDGEWQEYFDEMGMSNYIHLGGEGTQAATDLTEFKKVQSSMSRVQEILNSGNGTEGITLDDLDMVGGELMSAVDYDGTESADTPLKKIINQISEHVRGTYQGGEGTSETLRDSVNKYMFDNTPKTPEDFDPDWKKDLEESPNAHYKVARQYGVGGESPTKGVKWNPPSYSSPSKKPKDAHPHWPFEEKF